MATDNERVNSSDLLVAEYDQAEEHGRAAFSRENFHGSVKSWTEAARLAALLNRQDLVAKAYRHSPCIFSCCKLIKNAFFNIF